MRNLNDIGNYQDQTRPTLSLEQARSSVIPFPSRQNTDMDQQNSKGNLNKTMLDRLLFCQNLSDKMNIPLDLNLSKIQTVEEVLISFPYEKVHKLCQSVIPTQTHNYQFWSTQRISQDFLKLVNQSKNGDTNEEDQVKIICTIIDTMLMPELNKIEQRAKYCIKHLIGVVVELLKTAVKLHDELLISQSSVKKLKYCC